MVYPGYQLNPGDMFQVDPERVLFALGAPKDTSDRRAARKAKKQPQEPEEDQEREEEQTPEPTPEEVEAATKRKKKDFQALLIEAKEILAAHKDDLSAKRKQSLRNFQRIIRRSIGRPASFNTDDLDAQLAEITSNLHVAPETPPKVAEAPAMSSEELVREAATLSPEQLNMLRHALVEARENPVDPLKPYATPWRPRDFMSAFAFIPRYLEVNQKVCAAVYLRHPVARPGLAEVPTPFALETNSLAHSWYLRRR